MERMKLKKTIYLKLIHKMIRETSKFFIYINNFQIYLNDKKNIKISKKYVEGV